MQASNFNRWHIWPIFPLNFFYEIFTEDASLLLLYHSAKKSNTGRGWALHPTGKSNSKAVEESFRTILKGPNQTGRSLFDGCHLVMASVRKFLCTHTSSPTRKTASRLCWSAYNDWWACTATIESRTIWSTSHYCSNQGIDEPPSAQAVAGEDKKSPCTCHGEDANHSWQRIRRWSQTLLNWLESCHSWQFHTKEGAHPSHALGEGNSHKLWDYLRQPCSLSRSVRRRVSGWLAVLNLISVPNRRNTSLKNSEVNPGSRSQVIVRLSP